jgi:predicted GIY-YIG superfamily endonuclease
MLENIKHSKFPEISKVDNNRKTGVYILTQISTQKSYIGSTNDLYTRVKSHVSKLQKGKSGCRLLQEAFNNDPNFELRVIPVNNRDEAFELEQKMLDEIHHNKIATLNIAKDARIAQKGISSLLGHEMAEDVKKKISLSNLNKPKSEEHIKALTEVRRAKGRSVSICGICYRSCGDAAEALGLDYDTVYNRCSKDLISYKNWFFV